jgi:tetratricopeptide (TPR) repeat protein
VTQTLFSAFFGNGVDLMATAGESLDVIGQAIQSFDRAIALFPSDETVLLERQLADLYRQGLLFFGQKNWPQAVDVLQQIYARRPDYIGGKPTSMLCTAHLRLGDAYYEARDLERALEQYQAVLSIGTCDHVEAAAKEREVYLILYPPTPTPTRTPAPTLTPRATPTFTAIPTIPTATARPGPPPVPTSTPVPRD